MARSEEGDFTDDISVNNLCDEEVCVVVDIKDVARDRGNDVRAVPEAAEASGENVSVVGRKIPVLYD